MTFILVLLIIPFTIILIYIFHEKPKYDGEISKISEMNSFELKKHLSKKEEVRTKVYYYLFKENSEEFVKSYTKYFIDHFGYELIDVKYDYDLETFWGYDTRRIPVFNGICISYITHKYNFRNPVTIKKDKVIITYKTVPNYYEYFNKFGHKKM